MQMQAGCWELLMNNYGQVWLSLATGMIFLNGGLKIFPKSFSIWIQMVWIFFPWVSSYFDLTFI